MYITVLGSLNMDLVTRVQTLPKVGETVSGISFETTPGGKGANQAVAARRLGASVSMVGQVGDDIYGVELLKSLRSEDVSVENILSSEGMQTGVAVIGIEDSGLNSITAVYGVNMVETPAFEESLRQSVIGADVLLLQNEIPHRYNLIAAKLAKESNTVVIWDPAPANEQSIELADIVTFITPNEHELAPFIGDFDVDVDIVELILNMVSRLDDSFSATPVITLGEKGVAFVDKGKPKLHKAAPVDVVDTVAAGDAFTGALAVGISEGLELSEAIRFANLAGSICVQRHGAQIAMPTRSEVDEQLLGPQ